MNKSIPGILLILCWIISPGNAFSQWPSCDLYWWKLDKTKENVPVFLNKFHIGGYNNQPSFVLDNQILITSNFNTSGTDILWLNLDRHEFFPFTKTEKISEFSPVLTPDKKHVSVVRIEEDGKTQTLWLYPANRSEFGKNLLPNLENIGYYAWVDSVQVALFLVDSIHTLALANIENQKVIFLQENIGRCLKTEDNNIYFTKKDIAGFYTIKKFDTKYQVIETIFSLPEGTEDFEISTNGDIVYAQGGLLYKSSSTNRFEKQVIMDFTSFGIKNIKRVAIMNNNVIFVNQP